MQYERHKPLLMMSLNIALMIRCQLEKVARLEVDIAFVLVHWCRKQSHGSRVEEPSALEVPAKTTFSWGGTPNPVALALKTTRGILIRSWTLRCRVEPRTHRHLTRALACTYAPRATALSSIRRLSHSISGCFIIYWQSISSDSTAGVPVAP